MPIISPILLGFAIITISSAALHMRIWTFDEGFALRIGRANYSFFRKLVYPIALLAILYYIANGFDPSAFAYATYLGTIIYLLRTAPSTEFLPQTKRDDAPVSSLRSSNIVMLSIPTLLTAIFTQIYFAS